MGFVTIGTTSNIIFRQGHIYTLGTFSYKTEWAVSKDMFEEHLYHLAI